MEKIIEIKQRDFQQIDDRIKSIRTLSQQSLEATNQQKVTCLDHIIAWTYEIDIYFGRGIIKK